ncbi:MAG: ferredoxin-type protein NapF [Gammaproteobacteria bacterium]|jgi:ferredoxin-type protein NapF|nr:ferredoxin-type protein NapF [Gammaproteobacteria bacterium]
MGRSRIGVPDRSRRALLAGRARATPLLRPPWARDEAGFTAACTACNACAEACPPAVLVRGGGGFPEFDPARGECTFCGDCAAACGEGAFVAPTGRPWALRAWIGDACLAGAGVVCWSCRDACGESAIRFPPALPVARPQVAADRCTGCGGCVGACPTSAITIAGASAEVPVVA